ncbi:MAG: 5'-nucleotidase C-terminal domain-containing protein [Gammaproteobacteria bacterium]|nr:5'-nucleotidase C-terminal domain-containing protein [Gammaproteobacteria bacterium]
MSNFQLQLLHAADMEGGGGDLLNAPNFISIVDYLEDQYANSLFISSGDLVLPGPYLNAAGDSSLQAAFQAAVEKIYGLEAGSMSGITAASGRLETLLMDLIDAAAVTLGNHEFDLGTDLIAAMIAPIVNGGSAADIEWLGAQFPYLSANLDFSADAALSGLATNDIFTQDAFQATLEELLAGANTPKLAPAVIAERGGEQIGIIGLTTQILESISSPGAVDVITGGTNNMQALADLIQPVIDELQAQGINKIILSSHLQQIQFEEELATLLDGVDIIIAGGSNALLADQEDQERGLFPGAGEPYESYPILTQDVSGNDVVIVNTDGGWRYVAQLVVEFDEQGRVIAESIEEATSGVFASTDAQVEALWGDLESAFAEGTKGSVAKELVNAVGEFVAEQDGNILGLTDVYLVGEREAVRTEETNLGNLTADANLWYARQLDQEVMVSFKNGGGIREPIGDVIVEGSDSQPSYQAPGANPAIGKPAGAVSQLDAASSLRFNNDLTIISVTRSTLLDVLEHAVAASGPGVTAGQFAQVGGIQYSFDWSQPAGERIQNAVIVNEDGSASDVLVANGRLVGNGEETVKVVTLGFLADGGDGYPLGEGRYQDRVDLMDAFIDDGQFTFADKGTEQDAFAEYMASMFSETAFSEEETPASEDLRIQNLNERIDAIFDEPVDPLLRLYDAAFDRDADGMGLGYWTNQIGELSAVDIANRFIDSQEFIQLHGELDQGGFVDLMYANVLERDADAEGKAYWIGQLEAGIEQGAVMVGIAESEESIQLFA